MAESKHIPSGELKDLHVPLKGETEGGACLSGHSSKYADASSCTYRWQALQPVARERHSVYGRMPKVSAADQRAFAKEGISKGFLPTSRYLSQAGEPVPFEYAFQVALPRHPDDWRVGGPTRTDSTDAVGNRIPPGKNFTQDKWPYWNNAHHIIPKALLNRLIDKIEDPECRDLVRVGLLRAKYNVNHWINVVILPMDMQVARHLSLPRHLALEDETAVFEPHPKFDHAAYSEKVKKRLATIIATYKAAVQQAINEERCNAWSVVKLSKRQLEQLSKACYLSIVNLGATRPGASIGEIAFPD